MKKGSSNLSMFNMSIKRKQISPTVNNITHYTRGIIPNKHSKLFLSDFIHEKLDFDYLMDHAPSDLIFEYRQEFLQGCEEIFFTLEVFYWDKATKGRKTTNNALRLPVKLRFENTNEYEIGEYLETIRNDFTAQFFDLYEVYLSDTSFKLSKIIINLEFFHRKQQS